MNIIKGAAILSAVGGCSYLIIKDGERRAHQNSFVQLDTDPTLRKQEKDILIPSLMRKTAENVDCKEHVEAFAKCCKKFAKNSSKYSLMVFKECKIENEAKMNCMNEKFIDPDYYWKCKEMYLDEKHLRHTTGIAADNRKDCKKAVQENKSPKFFEKYVQEYLDNVKEHYEKTGDIEAFDKYIVSTRKNRKNI